MLQTIQDYIKEWGIPPHLLELVSTVALIVGIVILSIIVNYTVKRSLLRLVRNLTKKTSITWDDLLVKNNVFGRLAQLAPAFIIYTCSHLPFPNEPIIADWVKRLAIAYMITTAILVFDGLVNTALQAYEKTPLSLKRPLKSYAQVMKILLYLIGGVLILTTLMQRSPVAILSGFGAMTAIIMLVFKDSILGFVAGIQIAANDMVRKGDWIEMTQYHTDGDVIDISLNTVKIQNWDKTISTIPTYKLVSESFRNWRGMSESGGRRIKRSFYIDISTVRFLTDEEIARFEKVPLLKEYLSTKKQELTEHNQSTDMSDPINGRRLTNLGTLRAYLKSYLKAHPKIHDNMTQLVRQLAPTDIGVPIEIYVFSNDPVWANYEDLLGDIFDHVLATVPEFDLGIFQRSGSSNRQIRANLTD